MHPIAIAVVRSLIPQGGTPLIHEMRGRVLQVPDDARHLEPEIWRLELKI